MTTDERRLAAIDLAALLLNKAHQNQTNAEINRQIQIDRLIINDPQGKVFTTSVTDQCFRSQEPRRVADQLIYLMRKFNLPKFLPFVKRMQLLFFKYFGKPLAGMLVPLTKKSIRQETAGLILPGEEQELSKHLKKRKAEGVRSTSIISGEAILGEQEAVQRLQTYLDDLASPEVEYISVKISTICSQLNLLARDTTLDLLSKRLKELYRAAQTHRYVRKDGTSVPKFVNLDMEEYRDLHLTVDLFRRVLDDPEFFQFEAGIVLQSYLPDSFLIQTELTEWGMQRLERGGAPIKVRIVKGANLAMEQVEASIQNWPQAPYPNKVQVDANFKRMVEYGAESSHAKAVHLGIGTHNLFDIAYALLLRVENQVEPYVCFEMLEGMADPLCRTVQALAGDMLLYCPTATEEEFQFAVAYLVRRLDENTAPENFLRHAFVMVPGTKEWQNQAASFLNLAWKLKRNLSCQEDSKIELWNRCSLSLATHLKTNPIPIGLCRTMICGLKNLSANGSNIKCLSSR